MSRTSLLLIAAMLGLVLCSPRQAAEAAPITLGLEDFEQLAGVSLSAEASSSSATESEEQPTAANPLASPQQAMLPSGTTTGSSPSTVTPGGTSPSAIAPFATTDPPMLVTRSIDQPGSLFIPPRFLDGVFRPPRSVISL